MRSKRLGVVALSLLVVLAGCAGGTLGPTDSPATGPDSDANTGTMNFYVSDEPNAIGDFRHLNVTISSVGIHQAGNGTNETGQWIERDVDNRTVDLTRLLGANATLLDTFDVPAGNYTKVFAHVTEVNGTLESGEDVTVKLPSDKLQLNKPFVVESGQSVEFVFDIAVHEAGNSGKYILRPVVGESGTDVPIDRVDNGSEEDDDPADRSESELNATIVGSVTPGENATLEVTSNGTAVENATVTVNDERVGTTDGDGRLVFAVPEGTEEVTVEVTAGDAEAELEFEFGDG